LRLFKKPEYPNIGPKRLFLRRMNDAKEGWKVVKVSAKVILGSVHKFFILFFCGIQTSADAFWRWSI